METGLTIKEIVSINKQLIVFANDNASYYEEFGEKISEGKKQAILDHANQLMHIDLSNNIIPTIRKSKIK